MSVDEEVFVLEATSQPEKLAWVMQLEETINSLEEKLVERDRDHQVRLSPARLDEIASDMRAELQLKDFSSMLSTYKQCFSGAECCQFLMDKNYATDIVGSICVGRTLMQRGAFYHTKGEKTLVHDTHVFYRFDPPT
jgi:hypothetical protein